ncbi:hypothetical protein HHI36_014652 [Cryptolaemus montrouzieri]|uniref:HMG box domain-containing protein n=1 Tax=Cryptolaemus montrouzieri TaxID=559131 RepID=A0ABD2N3Q7_9CUCU
MVYKPSKIVKLYRKHSKTSQRRNIRSPITTNPFLNFFLSKCKTGGNSKLHRFAKQIGKEWFGMNFQEKTPYYQLADKANKARKKRLERAQRNARKENISSKIIPLSNIENTVMRLENNFLQTGFVPQQMEQTASKACKRTKSENFEAAMMESRKHWLDSFNRGNLQLNDEKFQSNGSKKMESKKDDFINSDYPSVTTSFHSMKNNCCSDTFEYIV